MKTKSMLEKTWWPEPRYDLPLAAALDPSVLFRHLVMCLARRTGLSLRAKAYALVATGVLHASDLRPDLGRQALEWVNQHRQPPGAFRPRRSRCLRPSPRPIHPRRVRRPAAIRPIVSPRSYTPPPARLAREALVTRLRDQDHLSFKEIALRLDTYRETIRQLYARAVRRRHQSSPLIPTLDRPHATFTAPAL